MQACITVVGRDQVGIIAKISRVCADHQVNIQDISQTIMQEIFTMTMIVDLSRLSIDFENFQTKVIESLPDLDIHVMNTDIFQSMHRI